MKSCKTCARFTDTKCTHVDFCGLFEWYIPKTHKSPADLPEAEASAEHISSVVRRLPEYNEIDQVANDEASGIDWNRLEYSGIYTDGFIAGALWMKSKVKQ